MRAIGPRREQQRALAGAVLPKSDPTVERRIKSAQAALFAAMEPVSRLLMPQDVIVAAGEQPGAIYRIQSGMLAERHILGGGRAHIASFLLPGDCFGVLPIITGSKSTRSVEALAPSTVAVVAKTQLAKLRAENVEVDLALMWLFCEAQIRRRDWESILAWGTAFEKIAAMLHYLCERTQRWQNSPDDPIRLPIGQREIAEHLGLTLPHVSRCLRQLRDTRLITSHYRTMEIRDPVALSRYVATILGTG